jgi:hypothetical protein
MTIGGEGIASLRTGAGTLTRYLSAAVTPPGTMNGDSM